MRNRLVGFATLLLILALIAPWIITDKSNTTTSTTPILQPNIVNQQFQSVEHTPDDSFTQNNSSEVANFPYALDTDQNPSSLISPEINAEDVNEPITTDQTVTTTQDSKLYMIQIAALRNKQKIEELVALLRLNNYNVKVIPKKPEPNQLIKLQVGPYAKREQAEQVIDNLNNLTKQKSIIITN
ncbi:SPOR domain-containing protein [Gilliamella sp. B3831]|nr:SPOR domain-containing protein [Gilliamella sp. B3831]